VHDKLVQIILWELVGGIAVVASVIYLTVQIRHGITGYQSSTLLQTTHHFSNLQLELAKYDVLLEAWAKAERGEPLNALDQRRVINIVSSYLIGFENMFNQCQNRMMQWEAYYPRRIILASFMKYTGIWKWWNSAGRAQFTPDFAMDIDKAIKDFNIELPEITKASFSK
jgi:hypothetical protein